MKNGRFVALASALLILFALTVVAEDENGWGDFEKSVEQAKTEDGDDIEEKVDEPVKIAQGKKGVVWGKSDKAKDADKNADKDAEPKAVEEKPQPKTTTVKRPVSEAQVVKKNTTESKPAVAEKSDKSGEKYLLKSDRKKGSADLVETLLEVSGDVKLMNEEQKQVSDKMEVVAGFRYEERIEKFSVSTGPLVGVRQYNLAKAKMKIADDLKTPELDAKLQTIVCTLDKDKVSLFSPNGPLRGEELLLIEDLPGNTLTLDRLLPNKEVQIGDSWKIDDGVLRSLLSVDAVIESEAEAVLTAVADNMAMVEIGGHVSGVYLGANTEMEIQAKYQFDFTTKRINWLGLLIKEDRSIGHVSPGFDLSARLQVKISPLEKPQSLTDAVMKDIEITPDEKVLELKYDGGKGPWRFSHHRDWYVFQDDPQTTILRKLHKGELVAQCNIADMGKVDVKTMASPTQFQKELKDGLGDSYKEIAAASEYKNGAGYKVYNVLIDGVVDDLPLRWIYNLLTAPDGRQSVVVFVVEASMLEQFGDSDEELLETFRMGKN